MKYLSDDLELRLRRCAEITLETFEEERLSASPICEEYLFDPDRLALILVAGRSSEEDLLMNVYKDVADKLIAKATRTLGEMIQACAKAEAAAPGQIVMNWTGPRDEMNACLAAIPEDQGLECDGFGPADIVAYLARLIASDPGNVNLEAPAWDQISKLSGGTSMSESICGKHESNLPQSGD